MSDKKLDTGTGGFSVDGKVHTYDVGVERDVADDGDWNSGDINVDKSRRDISKGTKITLGQYLGKTTRGKTPSVPDQAAGGGNRYKVDAQTVSEISTSTDGYPSGITRVPEGSFSPGLGNGSAETPGSRPTLPRPGWASDPVISTQISRGIVRKDEIKIDGNDLLRTATSGNSLSKDHPVKMYSTSLIKNRWTADSPFSSESSKEGLETVVGMTDYRPGESYKPEEYSSPALRTVNYRQLATVGNVLMARASTERRADFKNLDPEDRSFTTEAALIPGGEQLGIKKVEELKLTAKDVLENLALQGDKVTKGVNVDSLSSITPNAFGNGTLQSWGALNNPYDQFTGFSALGMQILAVAFTISIALIPGIISTFLSKTISTDKNKLDKIGRLPYGRWRVTRKGIPNLNVASLTTAIISAIISGDFNWPDLLGFDTTVYNLATCIITGIASFYGTSSAVQSGVSSPESYVVFSRAIFRSFLTVSDELKGISSAFTNSPIAGVQKILSFIEFFRRSKLMRSLNTFAQLGDAVLREPVDIVDTNSIGFGLKKSEIDLRPIDGRSAYDKSRLIESGQGQSDKSLRLAWSSFRSPDLLLIPQSLSKAVAGDSTLGAPALFAGSLEDNEKTGIRGIKAGSYAVTNLGYRVNPVLDRIEGDVLTLMEQKLDAEYMPFYFHDVRTNEIVSFHAFLQSLGDSYTAEYDTVDAFGRVEKIKTYKGTNRKIDVSFQVAALSPEDFEYMWIKLNKLSTLLYPQFTSGKSVRINKDNSVTVPFSQQIAAAPLVRLRIGDLIQSNYSRFNLSRLFGAYYEGNIINGKTSSQPNSNGAADTDKVTDTDTFYLKGEFIFDNSAVSSIVDLDKTKLALQVVGVKDGSAKLTTTIDKDLKFKVVINPTITDNNQKNTIKSFYDKSAPHKRILGEEGYIKIGEGFTISNLPICTTTTYNQNNKNTADYQGNLDEFMKPANNAVVRSFESSGGRGIPGFIESMNFDWYSGTVWEEEQGKRAPKMCKVTISFSPFHDIVPGLDHTGANRAPVYPIGPMAPRVRPILGR